MSEHPFNAMNREAVRRAQETYANTGDMALAIREAVIAANEEVETYHRPVEHPLFNRDVVNVLYCAGSLQKVAL